MSPVLVLVSTYPRTLSSGSGMEYVFTDEKLSTLPNLRFPELVLKSPNRDNSKLRPSKKQPHPPQRTRDIQQLFVEIGGG